MKRKVIALSQRYALALRKHLQQGPQASLRPAHGLGRRAAAMGLETLDVAKIHEGAMATLKASDGRNGIGGRAEIFFTEAITPIEKTHGAALRTDARLNHLHKTLGRRTVDLAAANRSLKQKISQRKTVEKALKASGGNARKLLEESRKLQNHLRHLTREILSAQEIKRKEISRELQDEIAQTLLGINVRLLSLKQQTMGNAEGLQNEVAITRRLVGRSMRIIKRFAREVGKP